MKKKKTQRGSIMMMVLPLVLGMFIVGTALFEMSNTSTRMANFGYEKAQADVLAESGLDLLYSEITDLPSGTTSINTAPINSTALMGGISATPASDGTYFASVISSSSATVNGQQTYTYVIQGTGVAPNGLTTSKMRSSFTVTQQGMSGSPLGNAAIKTAGNVVLSGNSFTSDNSGNHGASIYANGSITDSSSGMSIDGTAAYYQKSSLTGKAWSVQQMASLMSFPSVATTTSWRTSWLGQAEESTPTYPSGNIVNGNLSYGSNSSLTGPIFITGNLTVSGGHTLTINADPKATAPCVVFVHGTVTVSGGSSLINNGVLLVSDGSMTFSGTSAVYSAANMVDCGLISFSTDPINAISITGGSGVANVGVVYAVNGGATLSGGSVFQGSITCGGIGSTVTLSGGSSVRYQNGWNGKFGPFAPTYTSGSLGHWVRVQ